MVMFINSSSQDGVPLLPHLSAQQKDAIDRFASEHLAAMESRARDLSRRHHIDELKLPPGGVVQGALIRLCRAVAEGKLLPIQTGDDFQKASHVSLNQFVVEEKRRQRARKRGSRWQAVPVELDRIPSDSTPPDEQVSLDERVAWILSLLDRHDPSLGRAFRMRFDGGSHRAIASQLGESLWAIEEKFRKIRAILQPYLVDLLG